MAIEEVAEEPDEVRSFVFETGSELTTLSVTDETLQLDLHPEDKAVEKVFWERAQEDVEEVEDSTYSYEQKVDPPTTDMIQSAKEGERAFYLSLAFLATLLTGMALLWTPFFLAGAIIMFASLLIGYFVLIRSWYLMRQAKRVADQKNIPWFGKHKVIRGLTIAGAIGFGLGYLPLLLMILAGALGWYS